MDTKATTRCRQKLFPTWILKVWHVCDVVSADGFWWTSLRSPTDFVYIQIQLRCDGWCSQLWCEIWATCEQWQISFLQSCWLRYVQNFLHKRPTHVKRPGRSAVLLHVCCHNHGDRWYVATGDAWIWEWSCVSLACLPTLTVSGLRSAVCGWRGKCIGRCCEGAGWSQQVRARPKPSEAEVSQQQTWLMRKRNEFFTVRTLSVLYVFKQAHCLRLLSHSFTLLLLLY